MGSSVQQSTRSHGTRCRSSAGDCASARRASRSGCKRVMKDRGKQLLRCSAFVGHWAKIASELPHRTGSQCLSKWKIMVRVRFYQKSVEGPVPLGPASPPGGEGRRDIWLLALASLLPGSQGQRALASPTAAVTSEHSGERGVVLPARHVQACLGSLPKGLACLPIVPGP